MDSKTAFEKIKAKRIDDFLAIDKNPYVCYRFVVELEHLLPEHLSQIKPMHVKEGEMPDTADEITIELDPLKVYDRYVFRVLEEFPTIRLEDKRIEDLKDLSRMYMDYLRSNILDRLRMLAEDKEKWEKYI